MNARNNISKLNEAGIPAETGEFDCGCWGRHEPPYVEDGKIIFDVGTGYRSKNHLHGQNVYVLETDPQERIALVEMRKYGDMYGAGMWHYLVGVDGALFIAQISKNIDTLAESLESLKPAEVKRAEEAGLNVERQGDWYFVPLDRVPRGMVEQNQSLDDDHVAAEAILLKTVAYARGNVVHGEHQTLYLGDVWHKAIQNNAIRTGRLALGGHAD